MPRRGPAVSDITAPARLQPTVTVAGLWYRGIDGLCLERNARPNRNGARWSLGCILAPFVDEEEPAYRERLRRIGKLENSLLRVVLASSRVVVTTTRWRVNRGQDPLVSMFLSVLQGQGFGFTDPVLPTPHPKGQLCRLQPWCLNPGSRDVCGYCLDCFEATTPLLQAQLIATYRPGQEYDGNAREWIRTAGLAEPDMIAALEERDARKKEHARHVGLPARGGLRLHAE